MSVERQGNWLGGGRVDAPHIRAIESSIAADFDLLAGSVLAGKKPLVVKGFQLITTGITLATSLQLQVADSTIVHFYASESGSIFHVPANRAVETLASTNPRIVGSFTAAQVNYIGIDLVRTVDASTADLVQFISTSTLTETGKTVPLARTLDYKIVISTTDFDATPGVLPVARVTVDSSLQITQVEDARNFFWRLAPGGTSPNPQGAFTWPNGRKEGAVTVDFTGGDKAITSLKGWMDAVMTRLWEVGGGEFWYSPTQDHNVVVARTGTPFVSSGEYFEWSGTNLHWQGLKLLFGNSTGTKNTVTDVTIDTPGLTDLADGECIYVDLDRTQNATLLAAKVGLALLGTPDVPGSRWVLAWRLGSNIYVRDQSYAVGSSFKLATTAAAGNVKVSASDSASASPITVATVDSVSKAAYAGGLTRSGDFFGGAGDIQVGGFDTTDHNVVLKTFRDQDQVIATGSHDYSVNQAATFVATNLSPFDAHLTNLTARFVGFNSGGAGQEDAHQFEAGGAIGFRNVINQPADPTPTSSRPIRSKLFVRDNGVSSPNKRDQLCMLWWNGEFTVIAESEAY
jgi:hypothetical protein